MTVFSASSLKVKRRVQCLHFLCSYNWISKLRNYSCIHFHGSLNVWVVATNTRTGEIFIWNSFCITVLTYLFKSAYIFLQISRFCTACACQWSFMWPTFLGYHLQIVTAMSCLRKPCYQLIKKEVIGDCTSLWPHSLWWEYTNCYSSKEYMSSTLLLLKNICNIHLDYKESEILSHYLF